LILDMNMPRVSGLDVLKAYHFMETRMRMPVIMLSANALAETIEECRQAGASDYLTKPVDARTLIDAIDRLMLSRELDGEDVHGERVTSDESTRHRGVVDNGSLHELEKLSSDPEFVRDMVRRFMEELQVHGNSLRNAAVAGNADTFMDVVHSIKGGAATIGVFPLRQICTELEKTQRRMLTIPAMSAYCDRIDSTMQSASRELDDYLAGLGH